MVMRMRVKSALLSLLCHYHCNLYTLYKEEAKLLFVSSITMKKFVGATFLLPWLYQKDNKSIYNLGHSINHTWDDCEDLSDSFSLSNVAEPHHIDAAPAPGRKNDSLVPIPLIWLLQFNVLKGRHFLCAPSFSLKTAPFRPCTELQSKKKNKPRAPDSRKFYSKYGAIMSQ
jgi:hypothetical protein